MGVRLTKDVAKVLHLADETKLIIKPRLDRWLAQHGDDAFSPEVADWVRSQLVTPERIRYSSFSSSSAGQDMRKQIFDYMNAVKNNGTISPQLQQIFQNGTWAHLRLQAQMVMAGILGITDLEFPLSWPAMRSRGTMDGVGIVPADHPQKRWRLKAFGLELKTANMWSAQGMTGPESYIKQIARYFLVGGWELFVLYVENKNNQDAQEWVIERSSVAGAIEQQRKELQRLNKYVDDKELPPRTYCCKLSGKAFRDCPYGGNIAGTCAVSEKWDDVPVMPTGRLEPMKTISKPVRKIRVPR